MEFVKDGIIMGVGLSLMTGPIFFAILDQSIRNGKRAGVSLASGIWVSDVLFTTICFLFYDYLGHALTRTFIFKYLAPVGALLLLFFGLSQLRSASQNLPRQSINVNLKKGTKRKAWLMGFLMNAFNPFTILFWIGLVIYFSTGESLSRDGFIRFVLAMMLTIIALDVAKVVLAGTIRRRLNPKTLHYIKVITGWVFVLSAVIIAFEIFVELTNIGWKF